MYKRPLSGGVQSLQKFFLTERRSFNTNQPQVNDNKYFFNTVPINMGIKRRLENRLRFLIGNR